MKIGFDYISTVGKGGNATYSTGIIKAIINSGGNEHFYLYAYVHDVLLQRISDYKGYKNVHMRPVYISSLGLPIPNAVIHFLNKISFHSWSLIDRVDVFHFTNPLYFQKGLRKRTLVTIHDLAVLHDNTWAKDSSASFFRKNLKGIIEKSSKIISVSQYTKKDLIKTYRLDSDKIMVVYEAAGEGFYPDIDPSYIKNKFGIVKDFILYVGQLQPRKNILNLLKAYAASGEDIKNKFNLVLVGVARDKEYLREIEDTIKELGLPVHVNILNRVDGESLRKLYSTARVFVFPSLFEGFGLPIVESLKCGTPVITSNTTSLPEVAGRAGILIDPNSVVDLSAAFNDMLTNQDLYSEYKTEVAPQSNKFNWDISAAETMRIYDAKSK
jgi:glycosyltransferase involved in cell wall biosynthesis